MPRRLIKQAIHAELATLMATFSEERLEDEQARLMRRASCRNVES